MQTKQRKQCLSVIVKEVGLFPLSRTLLESLTMFISEKMEKKAMGFGSLTESNFARVPVIPGIALFGVLS